jgi:transposase
MLTKLQLEEVRNSKSICEGCRKLGVSTTTYYRDLKKFQDNGATALKAKSRRPKNTRKTNCRIEAKIIRMARSGQYEHVSQITRKLVSAGISISSNTVRKILRTHSLYGEKWVNFIRNGRACYGYQLRVLSEPQADV